MGTITRLTKDGYGQLELNQVAFRRDGRIEAQCALNATDFASAPAENGMILCVDNVSRTIKLPTAANIAKYPLALNYTTEHMYDDRANGLKNFKLTKNDGFYPRLGYLAIGDKFTTNTICYDSSDFADDDALKTAIAALGTTPLYAVPYQDGYWQIIDDLTGVTGLYCAVVTGTGAGSMPDGQYAVKLQVIEM